MQRLLTRAAAIQLFALLICASAFANAITATNPASNAKAASRTANVQATADSNIEAATVTQSTFRIQGEQTGRIAGTYSASGTTFQLDPAGSLKPGEWIRVSATSGIQSTASVALTKRVWQFTAATASATGGMKAHPSASSFGEDDSAGVALGDIDGDGDLDAVIANGGGPADPETVWVNNGAGVFTPHATTPSFGGGANSSSMDLALGDIDGDGDLDLVVANATAQPETVWLNDGAGNFSAHSSFGTGDSLAMALGDIDGDGDLDAVVANSFQGEAESVWLNNGSGTFSAHPTTPNFGGADSAAIGLGDIDSDGDLDAIVGNVFAGETVWVNDGSGSFSAHTTASFDGGEAAGIGLGDVDGDGDLDAVIPRFFGATTVVWLNDGSGIFTQHATAFGVSGDSRAVALGDLDGDGDLDAVITNANGINETVWLNDGSGLFTAHPSVPGFGTGYSYQTALGDLDGDGDLDAVVCNSTDEQPETVWLNSGITVTPTSGLVTTEGGGTSAFTVVLDSQPTANVSIQIDSGDTTEGRVSTDGSTQQSSVTLTFTNSDWSTPKTITLHGQNDAVDDGDMAYTITTAAAASTDVHYSGFNPFDVSASNTDNDVAGVTVTPTSVTVAETGTTASFTVVLNTEPTGNVVIDVASGDTSEATALPAQLTFNTSDWATPQTVTVTGINDAIDDGDQLTAISVSMNIAATADVLYDAIDPANVTATTTDNDFGIVSLSPAANTRSASRSATIQATANAAVSGATVTQSTFRVQGDLTGRVAGTFSAAGSTFELDPASNFKPGENIRATATNGVQGGSALSLEPHVWQFTAAAGTASGAVVAHSSFGTGNSSEVALGDLDGDGDLDAVVANLNGILETVWLNNGSGTFTPHSTPNFGDGSSWDIELGDLDGDGDLDAVVANFNGATTVWSNNGTGGFSALSSFASGNGRGLALGDLDGDGDFDVVLTNSGTGAETVWMNDGAGTFEAHPTTPSFGAGNSNEVALGDVDGDGDLDAVVANGSFQAETVWLNDGVGNFASESSFGTGPSMSVSLGDLDGDGDLDAVVANESGSPETVWRNDGSGNFTAHPTTHTFGTGDTWEVALGDLDGDGDLDAVTANLFGEAETVWLNDGTGAFSPHPVTPGFGAENSFGVTLGDVDGDGDLDVVVANSAEAETVWLNRNTAGITVAPASGLITTEAGGTATFTVVLDAAPLDDVFLDIAPSDTTEARVSTDGATQQTSVTLTFTTANWSTPRTITMHGQNDAIDDGNVAYTIDTAAATSTDPLYSGLNAGNVAATNNDDDTAGVTVSESTVSVNESGTTDTFTVVLNSEPVGNVVIDVLSADTGEATASPTPLTFTSIDWATPKIVTITGVDDAVDDGDQITTISVSVNAGTTADPLYDAIDPADVAATTIDDEILILLSTSPAANQKSAPRATNIAATGDAAINAATVTQSTFRIQGEQTGRIAGAFGATGATFQLDPTNTLKPGETVHVSATSGIASTGPVALTPEVWQFIAAAGTASGAMVAHPTTPAFGSGSGSDVALGDLDGDGDLDAVVAKNFGASETVWLNDGSGSLTPHPTTPAFGSRNSVTVALGDLDGDGDLDAVVANNGNDAETVWLNDGSGSFDSQPPTTEFGAGFSHDVALGDLDRDGDLDAVVANNIGEGATTWLNDGNANFSAHPTTATFGAGTNKEVVLGDLDGDGDLDAVIGNGAAEAETVWLNDGAGAFSAHPITPQFGGGDTWSLALGDLDGDGDLDALVANETTSESVWLNDGLGSLTPHGTVPTFDAGNSTDVALGDLDGDGDLDAIFANYYDQPETVWLNNGSGAFTAHPGVSGFGAGESWSATLGDLDGDGDLDAVVANQTTAQTVWISRPQAGIAVTPTTLTQTTELGNVRTFTVVLTSQPLANVSIQIDSSDTTEARLSTDGVTQQASVTVTFTSGNWNTPRTISVHGQNDDLDDGNIGYTLVTNAATSADPLYSGLNAPNVTGLNLDNDLSSSTVSRTFVSVGESGTTAPFTVVLTAEPTGNVVIDVASGDPGEATVSPAQLTFIPSLWATPQVVTVTGVDDALDDGNQTTNISLTVNAGATADPLYDPHDPADVTAVTIDDEDVIVISTSPDSNGNAAPRASNIQATADATIGAGSVSPSSFRIQGNQSGGIDGTYGAADATFQLDPTTNLKPGELIRATATMAIQSASASPLTPHVWQFTAAAGRATGAWLPHPFTPSFGSGDSYDAALGDLDGDGDLDAVIANYDAGAETVWRNDGAGNFTPHPTTPGFDAGNSTSMALGDLDGDGDLDALFSSLFSDETVWLNDGSGSFSAHPTTPAFGDLSESYAVALGDVDGDGDLDALVGNVQGPAGVWLNDGSGSFSVHPFAPGFGGADWVGSIALGDLDDDGDLDGVVSYFDGTSNAVWLNDSFGNFSAHPVTSTFASGTSGLISDVALGDLDGDGDLDAVAVNFGDAQDNTVWLNDGSGSFSAHPTAPTIGTTDSHAVSLADVDGDGDLDAVLDEGVWRNDGTGTFNAHPAAASFGTATALGDLDGDGDLDVLSAGNGAETVWLNAGITVGPHDGLVTTEDGGTDSLTVVLDTPPAADVMIQLTSSDASEALLSTDGVTQQAAVSLTFTVWNWSTPRTIFVHGQDDALADGNIVYTIVMAVAVSSDPLFSGIDPVDVSATNLDDDATGVTVSPRAVSVAESGTSASFNVVLDNLPAGDVVIDIESTDTGEATVSPAQLTFNTSNWSAPQPVTVTGVNDAIDDGAQLTRISVSMNTALTMDATYDTIDPPDVTATTSDNDLGVLSTNPAANDPNAPRTTNIQATADDSIAPASLTQSTFRAHGALTGRIDGTYSATGATFQLDPANDLKPGETISLTATSGVQSATAVPLIPHVWQFTAAAATASGVMIPHATPSFGGGTSIDVALGDLDSDGDLDAVMANATNEAETVWLNDGAGAFTQHPSSFGGASSNGVALGDIDHDGDLDAVVANGNAESTVWVNDGSGGFTAHATPTFAGSSGGNGVALGDLDGDGDLDAVLATDSCESVWRNNGSGAFAAHPVTPCFGGAPSYSVALGDLDGDGDLDAVVANMQSGSTPYDETIWFNDGSGSFTAPSAYGTFDAGSSTIVALGDVDGDGDLDALVVSESTLEGTSVWLNNGFGRLTAHPIIPRFGGGNSMDVALGDLDGDGDLDAVVSAREVEPESVWRNDGTGGFAAHPVAPTFGAHTSFGVALGDLDGDGDLDAVIANTFPAADTVWINRNPAGITVNPSSGLTTSEAGGTGTFTVVLDAQPLADVSIQLTSSDTTEAKVSDDGATQQSSVTLTFTNANWSTPKTVTLHGQNDDSDDGNVAYTIATAAAVSSDVLYSGLDATEVSGTNADNDTAGVTVTQSGGTTVVTEAGSTDTFTVVLATEPVGAVVIDISSGDPGEATVSPAQMTFTSADWSTPQSATVTGVNDVLDDGDQTTTIALAMNTGATTDSVYDAVDPADVTATTTDDDNGTSTALISSLNPALSGQSVTFTASVTSGTPGTITGSIVFKDGTTTIGTVPLSSGSASMSTSILSTGTHSITAEYSGGASFLGSTSTAVSQVINASPFGAPPFFAATATSTSQTTLTWGAVSGASGYEIVRTTSIGVAYTLINTTANLFHNDSGLSANTTYLYKVRAIAGGGGTSAFSAVDAATTILFIDPSLGPTVTVKSAHITQLRTAVNAMRTAAGLAAATFTDPTLTATVTKIKMVHVSELRTALDAARSTIGLGALTYTDPTITVGVTRVKREHGSELRTGTQ